MPTSLESHGNSRYSCCSYLIPVCQLAGVHQVKLKLVPVVSWRSRWDGQHDAAPSSADPRFLCPAPHPVPHQRHPICNVRLCPAIPWTHSASNRVVEKPNSIHVNLCPYSSWGHICTVYHHRLCAGDRNPVCAAEQSSTAAPWPIFFHRHIHIGDDPGVSDHAPHNLGR